MRAYLLLCCLTALITTPAIAADTHKAKVEERREFFEACHKSTLQAINRLDAELKGHGIVSPAIPKSREVLNQMLKAREWRDLKSRDTRKRKHAEKRLNDYLARARATYAPAREQLRQAKAAEEAAWELANPEEARLRKIEKTARGAAQAVSDLKQKLYNY